ncbi:MAG: DNA repair protein RecO [Bacteroidales bacterium]|jgi:DNA repair protein RecO (recombination protein O)|nr:DNA repair protein RecO [Bacteroidales bacterium]
MLKKTEGIVLHRIKYSETSFIVHIYTHCEGIASFIISNARSKRSQAAFFQPLHVVNFEYFRNSKSNLSRIKEISFSYVPTSLHQSIQKSTIAQFVSEFLYYTFSNKEENPEVYLFLRNFVITLDAQTESCHNAHIDFLLDFSVLCGIAPQNNYCEQLRFFDLAKGCFVAYSSATTCTGNCSKLLSDALAKRCVPISSGERRELLHVLLQYYSLHTKKIDMTRTLGILEMVFR